MNNPSYSSEIPRHTIILVGLPKQHLRGRCFRNDEGVEIAVCERLRTWQFHFYSDEILDSCQNETIASGCTGIMTKNNDTSVKYMRTWHFHSYSDEIFKLVPK